MNSTFFWRSKYFISSWFSKSLIEDAKYSFSNYDNYEENYIQLMSDIYDKNIEEEKFEFPLIFIIKEEMIYDILDISDNHLKNIKIQNLF